MSAPYKVMEQMQKTRPRRLRGNREVMIVMGCIIVGGMLMLVGSLNERLKSDNQKARKAQQTKLKVAAATDGAGIENSVVIDVSLNEQGQWNIADHGIVTHEQLLEVLTAKRGEADELGLRTVISAQISGDQPAKHFIELHRLAEECGLDEVKVAATAEDVEKWQQ